jgi:hypothetical protein
MNKNEIILNFCKKHQTWGKVFISWIEKYNDINVVEIENAFLLYLKHKNKLKSEITIDFAKAIMDDDNFPNRINIIETFTDAIELIIRKKSKEIFIKSLKTNKYKHLFNNNVELEINTILDSKITKESLKNQFFNKLAAYKSAQDLHLALIDFKNKNSNWKKEYYLQEMLLYNSKILRCDDNILVIEVVDYKACSALGSTSWCIARSEGMFFRYTGNDYINGNKQYIKYDFNLPIEDNKSMIGYTVDKMGDVKYSHLKNDSETTIFERRKEVFPKISKEEAIEDLNKIKNNQQKFEIVCSLNIIDIYDEYRNKKNVFLERADNSYLVNVGRMGNKSLIEKILNDKEKITMSGFMNIIYGSVKSNRLDIFSYLMFFAKNNNYTITQSDKKFIISMASEEDSDQIMNALIDKLGCIEDFRMLECIRLMINNSSLKVFKIFFNRYEERILKQEKKIIKMIRDEYVILSWLISEKKIDPSASKNVLIINASHFKKSDLVDILVKNYDVCRGLNKVWCINNLTPEQYITYKFVKADK